MGNISMYLLCVHLLVTVTLVAGGIVRVAGPEEEAYALQMWRDMCQNYQNGAREFATDGNNNAVYCAQDQSDAAGLKTTVDLVYPTIQLPSSRNVPANQIIVIDPPAQHFKHKINIEGNAVPAPKTTIYVRPSADRHQLEVIRQGDANSQSPPPKPTIIYLGHNGDANSEAQVLGGNFAGSGGVSRLLSKDSTQLQGQGSEAVEQRISNVQQADDDKENLISPSQSFRREEDAKVNTATGNDISTQISKSSTTQDQDQIISSGTVASTNVESTTTATPSITSLEQGSQGQWGSRSRGSANRDEIAFATGSRIISIGQGSRQIEESTETGRGRNSGLVIGADSVDISNSGKGADNVLSSPSSSNSGSNAFQSRPQPGVGFGRGDSGLIIENGRLNEEQGAESLVRESIGVLDNQGSISSGSSSQTPSEVYFRISQSTQEPNTRSEIDDQSSTGGLRTSGISYSARYGDSRSSASQLSSYQIGVGARVEPSGSVGRIGDGSEVLSSLTSYPYQPTGVESSDSLGSSGVRLTFATESSPSPQFQQSGSFGTYSTTVPEPSSPDYTSTRYASGSYDYSQMLAMHLHSQFQTPSSSSSSQERRTSSSSSFSTSGRNPTSDNDSSFPYSVAYQPGRSQNPATGTDGVAVVELTAASNPLNVNDNGQGNGVTTRRRRKKQRGQGQQNVDPNGDATSSVFFEMDHSEMMHYSVRHPY